MAACIPDLDSYVFKLMQISKNDPFSIRKSTQKWNKIWKKSEWTVTALFLSVSIKQRVDDKTHAYCHAFFCIALWILWSQFKRRRDRERARFLTPIHLNFIEETSIRSLWSQKKLYIWTLAQSKWNEMK